MSSPGITVKSEGSPEPEHKDLDDPQKALNRTNNFLDLVKPILDPLHFADELRSHLSIIEIANMSQAYESFQPCSSTTLPIRAKLLAALESRFVAEGDDIVAPVSFERSALCYLLEWFSEEERTLPLEYHRPEEAQWLPLVTEDASTDTSLMHSLASVYFATAKRLGYEQLQRCEHYLDKNLRDSQPLLGRYHADTMKSLRYMIQTFARGKSFDKAVECEDLCRRKIEEMAGPQRNGEFTP